MEEENNKTKVDLSVGSGVKFGFGFAIGMSLWSAFICLIILLVIKIILNYTPIQTTTAPQYQIPFKLLK